MLMIVRMLTVVGCSGGKDSVASVILFHKYYPEVKLLILTSEVYFDLEKQISGENPVHMQWIKETMIPTFESWGHKCVLVHSPDRDYLSEFYHIVKGATKHPEHNGRPYGFAIPDRCMIRRDLKIGPCDKYLNTLEEPFVKYLGICIDEPKRLSAMHERGERSILEEFRFTERDAWNLCCEWNLLSPVYEYSYRQGCWMCGYAKCSEQKYIKEHFPLAWNRFLKLEDEEDICFNKWSTFGSTLKERNKEI